MVFLSISWCFNFSCMVKNWFDVALSCLLLIHQTNDTSISFNRKRGHQTLPLPEKILEMQLLLLHPSSVSGKKLKAIYLSRGRIKSRKLHSNIATIENKFQSGMKTFLHNNCQSSRIQKDRKTTEQEIIASTVLPFQ